MTKNRRAKQDARKRAAAQNKPYAQAFREASEEHSWMREHDIMDRKRSEFMELFDTGCDVNVTHSINSAEDIDRAIGMIAAAKRQMAYRVQSVIKALSRAAEGDGFWVSSKVKGELVSNPILITLQGFDPDDEPTGDKVVDQLSEALRDDLAFIMRSGKEYGVTVMKVAGAAGPGTKIHLRHSSNGTAPNPKLSFMDTLIAKMKSKDSFTVRVELSEPEGVQNAIDLINFAYSEAVRRWHQLAIKRGIGRSEEYRLLSVRPMEIITEGFNPRGPRSESSPSAEDAKAIASVIDGSKEGFKYLEHDGRRIFVDCWSHESSSSSPAIVFKYSQDTRILNGNSAVPIVDTVCWSNERKKVSSTTFALQNPIEGSVRSRSTPRIFRTVGLLVTRSTTSDEAFVAGLIVNWQKSDGGWSDTTYTIPSTDKTLEWNTPGLPPLAESALLKSVKAGRVADLKSDHLEALRAEYTEKLGGKTVDDYPVLRGFMQ